MHAFLPRIAIAVLFCTLLAVALDIRAAHAELDKNPIPIGSEPAASLGLALGDMDGDGDLDVALANQSIPSQVFRNDGAGAFTLAWQQPQFVAAANDVKWGDLDGDGDLDLVFGYSSQSNQVYRNDVNTDPASGQLFVLAWQAPSGGADTRSLAIGDLNGDGRLDLVFATVAAGTVVMANGGSLVFSTAAVSSIVAQDVDLGDMDGDGDLDIALAASTAPVLRNQGGLVFEQLAASAYPDALTEISWADAEGDGDLDLLSANGSAGTYIFLHTNNADSFSTSMIRSQSNSGAQLSGIAWVDYDNDGDADILTSNYIAISEANVSCGCIEVWTNNGSNTFIKVWDSTPDRPGYSALAVGDLDNDGALDIAGSTLPGFIPGRYPTHRSRYYPETANPRLVNTSVGDSAMFETILRILIADLDNDGDQDVIESRDYYYRIKRNDNGVLSYLTGSIPTATNSSIRALAAGDIDLDGDLDLAIGFSGSPLQVLRNDGNFTFVKIWEAAYAASTYDLTWADMDGDGLLDLVAANNNALNTIYRNSGYADFSLLWSDSTPAANIALAISDVDADGDSDVAFARTSQPTVVLRNNGDGQLQPQWQSAESLPSIVDIALGDLDGDGLPELVSGDKTGGGQVQKNTAGGQFGLPLELPVDDTTASLALGDVDSDGDSDIAVVGGSPTSSVWLLENHGNLSFSLAWQSQTKGGCAFCSIYDANIAVWADMTGDGALELVVGGDSTGIWDLAATTVYRNVGNSKRATTANAPALAVHLPNTAGASNGGVGRIADSATISMSIVPLPAKAPVAWVDATYSPDGGGTWLPALLGSAGWIPGSSVYPWDTFASGFFGQSDYVLFRLRSLAQSPVPYPANTILYTNTVAGPFQYAERHSTSTPFRVRGTQVRVVDTNNTPQGDAVVYRLPAAALGGGAPITASAGAPYRTSGQGYLQGRGALAAGDHLLALAPITSTARYTFYHTSGQPIAAGLNDFTVTQAGVQTLTVSAANPLLLLNLTASLEWDASNDAAFLPRLEADLRKASAALYDWTNGQVALGAVTVYQARQGWDEADIRIYASNQVRPSANRGGIVSDTLVLTGLGLTEPITATRGEIRIGAEWNRYGDVQPMGEDWPRVLAHELGHFALFLEDTYLGLDPQTGVLIPVESCTGTAMSDPYDEVSSELRFDSAAWQAECGASLAELPDWSLLRLGYPGLRAPAAANSGPALMPYAFTRVSIQPPPADPEPLLIDANLPLENGAAPLAGGRTYLLRGGSQIIDLGQAGATSVQARGAREGDQLCIFTGERSSCTVLRNGYPPAFTLQAAWRPDLSLTPVNTTTLRLRLDGGGSGPFTATVYPNNVAPTVVTLTAGVEQTITLAAPAVEAAVLLAGPAPAQRLITSYMAGSGPGRARSHDGPGRARSHDGPFSSGDGRVVLYPPLGLPQDVFMVVQTATNLPAIPPGRALIGRAYHVRASAPNVNYAGASIAIQYFGMDVLLANQPEANLTIYRWTGTAWQWLATKRNARQNIASAALPGPGLYALLSGYEIPLRTLGWNAVGYPVEETRPVTLALQSINGAYTTVFGYYAEDAADPWKRYSVGVPDWANDLRLMEFARGYWINATKVITWYIAESPLEAAVADESAAAQNLPPPPATLYGAVTAGADFTPAAGQPVVAYVDSVACGQSATLEADGAVVYAIDVEAASPALPACGAPGRQVTLVVAGVPMANTVAWDNNAVQHTPLTPAGGEMLFHQYLPAVKR